MSQINITNTIATNLPVHHFHDQILIENFDYEPDHNGLVEGYGENPVNITVIGTSTYDPEPFPCEGHGVVDSRTKLDAQCTILFDHPSSLNELRELLYEQAPENCCQWHIKAAGDKNNRDECFILADGCDPLDTNNLNDFAIRALYQFAKFVFHRLAINEKIIINGLLTLLSQQSLEFDEFLKTTPLCLLWSVYQILYKEHDLPQSVANFAGISLGKIEDFLLIEESDENRDNELKIQI